MHECPKTHFKHKCMHDSHHATSSCHVTMPHHHAMLACHIIMPHHHAMSACHIIMPHHHAMSLECTFDYHVATWGSATWHFSQNFPCWGQTSKCNIFCIQSPFDTPFAPLESAWRALRHGTIFVAIWWFWKLAFLDPPGSFLPTSKAFGPQKLLVGMLIYFLLHWCLHKLTLIPGFSYTAKFCS